MPPVEQRPPPPGNPGASLYVRRRRQRRHRRRRPPERRAGASAAIARHAAGGHGESAGSEQRHHAAPGHECCANRRGCSTGCRDRSGCTAPLGCGSRRTGTNALDGPCDTTGLKPVVLDGVVPAGHTGVAPPSSARCRARRGHQAARRERAAAVPTFFGSGRVVLRQPPTPTGLSGRPAGRPDRLTLHRSIARFAMPRADAACVPRNKSASSPSDKCGS